MISVIIPLYNVEGYIGNCLKSFENQIHKDFEIIVVNDGSTDRSPTLVEQYISNSKMNIKLVHQKNAGVSAARNKGIENSQGQFLCFVDSDDMVAPDYLSKMFNVLNDYKYDMAICGVEVISDECSSNGIYSDIDNFPIKVMGPYDALEKFLYRYISPGVWSLMIRKEIIRKNKLLFAEGFRYSEDIELIYKMMAHSNKIVQLKDKLYLYRIRNTSVMSVVDDKRLDGFVLMKNLESYFDKTNANFGMKFKKFGVARWVWATLWQSALASKSFNEFQTSYEKYNAIFYVKRLITFPRIKVSISSLLFILSPYLYYKIVISFGKKRIKTRSLTN